MQVEGDHSSTPAGWRFGRFELHPARRRLLRDREPVDVEERAFDLLVLLVANHQRELDRREITETLWGSRPVSDNTLRQVLYKARRAVDDDGERQAVIRTLHGRSLTWVAPLQALDSPAAPVVMPSVGAGKNRTLRHRLWWVAAAVLVLAVISVVSIRTAKAPSQALLRLVIAPFDNQTGDTTLAWTVDGLPGLLASLLSEAGGVDVVDPLESARVWNYRPAPGRSREQHLLRATGAGALVAGRLRKLTSSLYELRLSLTVGSSEPHEYILTDANPGRLVVDAVARIRRTLSLAKPESPEKLPRDAFFAEAYGRGMDLAAQGKWADAREYFLLSARGAPDFLPATLNLGLAQAMTDDFAGGERTLQKLVQQAKQQGHPHMVALAYMWLGRLARDNGHLEQALGFLRQVPLHAEGGNQAQVEVETHVMLGDVLYMLHQREESSRELRTAENLLKQHPELQHSRGVLYDIQSSIAYQEGDFQATLDAARAGLQLRQSLGNERGTLVSMFYIAYALQALHRGDEAVAVSASAYRRALAENSLELAYDNASILAVSLLDLGLTKPVIATADRLQDLGAKMKIQEFEILAMQLRAQGELTQGDFQAALADLRRGDAHADAGNIRHEVYLDQVLYEGMAAFAVAPVELKPLIDRFEANVVKHKGEGDDRRRVVLRALVAAADGRARDAVASLRAAANTAVISGDTDFENRMPALQIALANHDQAAAQIALAGYDPGNTADASLLPMYIQWATQRHDTTGAARAEARLSVLRKKGLAALAAAHLNPDDPLAASP